MRYIFRFPDIGEGIAEGKILEWYVKKGQAIKSGDPIVKMETDKVVTDIPSPKEGTITMLYGDPGTVINVDDPLVEIAVEGAAPEEVPKDEKPEEKEQFGVVGEIQDSGDSAYLPASDEVITEEKQEPEKRKSRVLATPLARNMAKEFGLDINEIKGSGPGGRVTKKDILSFRDSRKTVAAPAVADEEATEIIKLTQTRKTIAEKMVLSKTSAPHMTLFDEVVVDELVKIRGENKTIYSDKGVRFTYMPFILKAVVLALKEFPALNAALDMENSRMLLKKFYNIGIAIDAESGLVVPVIKSVDKLSIFEIASQIENYIKQSEERSLNLPDLTGGTFTVTNYGAVGGAFGVPIINYPQVAILGTGMITKKPVVEDDEIRVASVLPLSLSVDHRIVDGAEATRFMKRVMYLLGRPVELLLL